MYNRVFESVEILLNWIEQNQYKSYDHYDYWSSKFGLFSRRIFYRNKFLGLPLISSVYLIDNLFPGFRGVFAKKESSAESVPRIVMAYFRLFQCTNNSSYLQKGCALLDWLVDNVSLTNHGLGWGLHFDCEEIAPMFTPCTTITAYSTEALIMGFNLTGNIKYLNCALQTGEFVAKDLNRREFENSTALSYTPIDNHYVINANSYSARILLDCLKIKKDETKFVLMNKIVNYILEQQNSDGSWYYYDKQTVPTKKNFIDSFHTCFVLENLFEIWNYNKNDNVLDSLKNGFEFFLNNFINEDYSIRYYFTYPYPTGISVDIRGCAETIYCCTLLAEIFPHSLEIAEKISNWVIKYMQDKDGYFYFRIILGYKQKFPYIRWAQAPMLNALTFLLQQTKGTVNDSHR